MMLNMACLYFFLLYKTSYLNKGSLTNLKTQAELIMTVKSFTAQANDADRGMLIGNGKSQLPF